MASTKEDQESWLHAILEIIGNVALDIHPLKVPEDDDEGSMSPEEISKFIKTDTVESSF